MSTHLQTQRGVTLIETIIYIALFSILLGGAFVAAYNIFESNGSNQTQAMVLEEGNFLLGKVGWALMHAQSVDNPLASTTDSVLSISSSKPPLHITFAQNGGVTMSEDGAPAQTLTNSNVSVTGLTFSWPDTESLSVDFILSARSPEGRNISESFSETYFLQQ